MGTEDPIRPEASIEDIIRVAIKRENAAFHFYTEAAKRVHSTETRDLLMKLAREESEHERALTVEYNHLIADREVGRAMGLDT